MDAVELDNYELGSKGTYLDGRLQLAVGAFLMDYDGFHLSALQPLTEGSTVGVWEPSPLPEYTANVPGATIWGLEIEYNYAMTDNLRFMGFYAYQDSEIGPHESVVRGDPDAGYALWDHIDFDTGEPFKVTTRCQWIRRVISFLVSPTTNLRRRVYMISLSMLTWDLCHY